LLLNAMLLNAMLLCAVLLWRQAATAIDRYLLPDGPTAANQPKRHAAVDR